MISHFKTMAAYNLWANARLCEDLRALSPEELQAEQGANFGSIMGILNHLLLGDRLWLNRFTGQGTAPARLNEIPYPEMDDFMQARTVQDKHIEAFAGRLDSEFLGRELRYMSTTGNPFVRPMSVCVSQLFNHQTHHRGQVHGIIGRYGINARDLDLIFFENLPRS